MIIDTTSPDFQALPSDLQAAILAMPDEPGGKNLTGPVYWSGYSRSQIVAMSLREIAKSPQEWLAYIRGENVV